MRVMLHGATNTWNFGDYLFAEMFYETAKGYGFDVEFYNHPRFGVSEFYRKHMHYTPGYSAWLGTVLHSDALVFIPGGYFIESSRPDLPHRIYHYLRYCFPALCFMARKKKILIAGPGMGPFKNALFSRTAKKIIGYAECVLVRNQESFDACRKYGINRKITVTADTVLALDTYLRTHGRKIPEITIPEGEKTLVIHLEAVETTRKAFREKIKPAIECFLNENPEYRLHIVADEETSQETYSSYKQEYAYYNPVVEEYDDPWKLCAVLKNAGMIITTKLHVGIVGCNFGRTVLSFPSVPNKTLRFYHQIGEPGRCLPLMEATVEKAYEMMNVYKDRPAAVLQELRDLALLNLTQLEILKGDA